MIIVVDTREKAPLQFPTGVVVVRQALAAGDYRWDYGTKPCVAERKTVHDLYRTFADVGRTTRQLDALRDGGARGVALLVQGSPEELLNYTGAALIGRNRQAFLSHVYRECRKRKVELVWAGEDAASAGCVLVGWFKSFC